MDCRPIDKGVLGNRLLGKVRSVLSRMVRSLSPKSMATAVDQLDPSVFSAVVVVRNNLVEAPITNIHALHPLRELLDKLVEVELLRMVRVMYSEDRFPVDANGGYKLVLRNAGQSIVYRFLGKDLLADRGSVEEVIPLLSPGEKLYVLGHNGSGLMQDKYFGVSRKSIPLMGGGMLNPGTLTGALEHEKRSFADTAEERKETAQCWNKKAAIVESSHEYTLEPTITGPNTAGQYFVSLAQVPKGHSVRNIPFIPHWDFGGTTWEERVKQLLGKMLEMSLKLWPPLKIREIESSPQNGILDSLNVLPFYPLADCLHLLYLVDDLRKYRVAYTSKSLPVDSRGSYFLTYPISNGQEKTYRPLGLKDCENDNGVDMKRLLMSGEHLENIPFHDSIHTQLCFAVSQRKRPPHMSSGFKYRELEKAFEDEFRIFKSINDG